MALTSKLALICLVMGFILTEYQSNAGSIKDMVKSTSAEEEPTEGEEIDSFVEEKKYVAEKDKDEVYYIGTSSQKPSVFQNIADKLGFGKPKPPKKPLIDLENLLKPKPKPIVTSTKTLVLEVTKRLTRHPVCIASKVGLPPCVSNIHEVSSEKKPIKKWEDSKKEKKEEQRSYENEDENLWADGFKDEGLYIEPVSSREISSDLDSVLPETSEMESRSGRYLKFSEETPAMSDVKSAIEEGEIEDYGSDDAEERKFLFKKAETKVVTKTLWVTKVQKVTDYRVTATLVPENCVPSELNFPRCSYPNPSPIDWKNIARNEQPSDTEEVPDLQK